MIKFLHSLGVAEIAVKQTRRFREKGGNRKPLSFVLKRIGEGGCKKRPAFLNHPQQRALFPFTKGVFVMPFSLTSRVLALWVLILAGSFPLQAQVQKASPKTIQRQLFDHLLAQHQDLTYDDLVKKLAPLKDRDSLDFNPAQAKFYQQAVERLQFTDRERAIFAKNGFVSIDHDQRYSFGSAYYAIYTRDLPVLVTTDSILHAMHQSYDDVLKSLEGIVFSPLLKDTLQTAHERLGKQANPADHHRDADLYLTVARNLLAGVVDENPYASEEEKGKKLALQVDSQWEQNEQVLTLLKHIRSLKLQFPQRTAPTKIYGGARYVDYSQFRPRGHYIEEPGLRNYFRAMMWLGRSDTGFHVLQPDSQAGHQVDVDRELRAAVTLSVLLQQTGGDKALASMDRILAFLVGKTDGLSVPGMQKLLRDLQLDDLDEAVAARELGKIKRALKSGKYAEQKMRSQLVMSPHWSPKKIPPPMMFQVFSQRDLIDSFLLTQVVYDSILFEGRKQRRLMPQGLDVMAALGNDEAVRLLEPELRQWRYGANLQAARDYANLHQGGFWRDNLYNLWLDSLRLLDDAPAGRHFPQAMQTQAWRRKQLQTQLASWAELRRDTVLYASPSYTSGLSCEYPEGYVEPYPQFYAAIGRFGAIAGERFQDADLTSTIKDAKEAEYIQSMQKDYVKFFQEFARTTARLEQLAKKELAAEPFSADDVAFLKKTIDRRGGGSGPPRYDGWYSKLYYNNDGLSKWDPSIIDIHTDPTTSQAREVGVGDVNFLAIAIDNQKDRTVYVGPAYSYYEFNQPTQKRLDSAGWKRMLRLGQAPKRPEWTSVFQGPKVRRSLPKR